MYNVPYPSAVTVPRFGGKFGIVSQVGRGNSDGLFVPLNHYFSLQSRGIFGEELIAYE